MKLIKQMYNKLLCWPLLAWCAKRVISLEMDLRNISEKPQSLHNSPQMSQGSLLQPCWSGAALTSAKAPPSSEFQQVQGRQGPSPLFFFHCHSKRFPINLSCAQSCLLLSFCSCHSRHLLRSCIACSSLITQERCRWLSRWRLS